MFQALAQPLQDCRNLKGRARVVPMITPYDIARSSSRAVLNSSVSALIINVGERRFSRTRIGCDPKEYTLTPIFRRCLQCRVGKVNFEFIKMQAGLRSHCRDVTRGYRHSYPASAWMDRESDCVGLKFLTDEAAKSASFLSSLLGSQELL